MKFNRYIWISLGMVAFVSAIAYLPLMNKFGYYFDDWYLMYDVRTFGAQFFHAIFSSDRPGRAFLMIPVYSLYGLNPLPYNVSAYLFRLLGGVSLFWVLNILWPLRKIFTITAAILFTIYPGFLSQYNAIDYQSHILALFLAVLSIALTLKSILAESFTPRILWGMFSILLGWAYLSQMEYFIGIEAFRLACITLLVWRTQKKDSRQNIRAVMVKWSPFTTIPIGFLSWRIFFFQTERKATDIGSQIGMLFKSPLTGLWWATYLVQDFFNVLLAPWILPFSIFVLPMRLQNQLIGFGLATLAFTIYVWGCWLIEKNEKDVLADPSHKEMREYVLVGIASILGGLAPVIAANRHIVLPDYSRYTLIASIGAVIIVSAFLHQLSFRKLRVVAAGFLVAISALTHYGNSVEAANETKTVQDFWWQVAWRAPQIETGTTLSVTYPDVAIQEDYFIWGPANHIYYPETRDDTQLQIDLPAIVLNEITVSKIISGRGKDAYHKRGDVLIVNEYDNVLIIAQADGNSCVRVLDGDSPDLSVYDRQRVMLVAPYSKLERVITNEKPSVPPRIIFGAEPPHDWCFYYQKADLARQMGDWSVVVSLYEDAMKYKYHPNDQVELMPFLQAYAYFGDHEMVKELSTRINTSVFYAEQACAKLNMMAGLGYHLDPDMQNQVKDLFCK